MKQKKTIADHNKYRSSMVEVNMYNKDTGAKINQVSQHQVTQS